MRAWMRLAIAAFVAIGAGFAMWSMGQNPILIEDVRAVKHGNGMLTVSMTVRNTGAADRLVGVGSAESPDSHFMSQDAELLPIPAETSVTLSEDGAHVMMMEVDGELDEGRLIPLSLDFEKAGTLAVKARIGKPMMMAHMSMGMGEMDMSGMGQGHTSAEGEAVPSLAMSAAPMDDGGWKVSLETSNFTFSKDNADGPHVPGEGHGHLYVGGVKLQRLFETESVVPPLPSGTHIIRVTLNTNDHKAYMADGKPVTATAEVTVP